MANLSLFHSRVEAIAPNGLGLSGRRCFPPSPLSLNRREEDAPPPLRGRKDGRTTDKVSRGRGKGGGKEEESRQHNTSYCATLNLPQEVFQDALFPSSFCKIFFVGMRIKRCSKQMGKKLVPEANI